MSAVELFVYGSLKRGGSAHHLLKDGGAHFLREAATLPHFSLLDQAGYPALAYGGSSSFCGEVFLIPLELLPLLDAYEDVPLLYHRRKLLLSDGSSPFAYLHPSPPFGANPPNPRPKGFQTP